VAAVGTWHLKDCVLQLQPYVGIRYDAYDYSKFSAVLHGTFHSGTACAEKTLVSPNYGKNSILSMIDQCASLKPAVDTYYSPSQLGGEVYETVNIIGHHTAENNRKIHFLYGYTTELAYAKLLLAYSVFDDIAKRRTFMDTECNFECIDEKRM